MVDAPSMFDHRPRSVTTVDWPRASIWRNPRSRNLPHITRFPGFVQWVSGGLFIGFIFLSGTESSRIEPALWLCLAVIVGYIACVRLSRTPENPFCPEDIVSGEELVVKLGIYVNGHPLGQDSGILGIEDDVLFFAGNACSFALGSQDVDCECSFDRQWRSSLFLDPNSFLMRIKHPRVKLELMVSGGEDRDRISSLARALKRFGTSSTPTQGRRSFPPMSLPSPFRMPGKEI